MKGNTKEDCVKVTDITGAMSVRVDGGKVVLSGEKCEVRDMFGDIVSLICCDGELKGTVLDLVGVSEEVYDKFRGSKAYMVNPQSGKGINVKPVAKKGVAEGNVVASAYLKECLSLKPNEKVLLCAYNDIVFTEVKSQNIDNIREDRLVMPLSDYERFIKSANGGCQLFELYNVHNQSSLIIKSSHIYGDKSLGAGTLKINKKQRTMLGLELPLRLSKSQWKKLTYTGDGVSGNKSESVGGKKVCSPEDIEIIKSVYPTADHVRERDVPFDVKRRAADIIESVCGVELRLIPVPEAYFRKKQRHFLKWLADKYVGKSTLSLLVQRPLENDEGQNVVRMTKSNMNLLGIDEMDKVILQHKNKRIRCRVLEFEDKEDFYRTNLPLSPGFAVGVPTHLRKLLGITDVNTIVKIDRDTGFIFRKSINNQILPVLLTLVSANLFIDKSVWISAALSVVAIPFVVYFNLSSKRNMRA